MKVLRAELHTWYRQLENGVCLESLLIVAFRVLGSHFKCDDFQQDELSRRHSSLRCLRLVKCEKFHACLASEPSLSRDNAT